MIRARDLGRSLRRVKAPDRVVKLPLSHDGPGLALRGLSLRQKTAKLPCSHAVANSAPPITLLHFGASCCLIPPNVSEHAEVLETSRQRCKAPNFGHC